MTEQNTVTLDQDNPTPDVVLEVHNITKRFPGVVANDQVNFKLHRGEIVALLGENGAGKSTLMNIIYGLYQQTEGDVFLKGKEVRFASPREAIHSGIGMVHQHFQLVDVMTVAENVVLGEEKEAPSWASLFSTFFATLFGLLFAALFVTHNHPLVYDTVIFGVLILVLPWYLGRYLFRPIGLSIAALLALVAFLENNPFDFGELDVGLFTASLRYPYADQYLFVDVVAVLTLLFVLYSLVRQLPSRLLNWLQANLATLTIALQVVAGLLLLYAGADANSIGDAFSAYGNALGDAFNGTVTPQFEVLQALAGMGILAMLIYGSMLILIRNPLQDRLEMQRSELAERSGAGGIWSKFVSMVVLSGSALLLVGVLALLSVTIWPDNNDLLEMRTFLAEVTGGALLISLVAMGSGLLFAYVFESWDAVVGGFRLALGVAWRVGLVAVALWIGTQGRNIIEMSIITAMLQTDVPLETATAEEVDGATVGAGVATSYRIEPSWRSIDREESRQDQINALLEEIDEAFLDESSGEYVGISENLRESVDEVPPVVGDVVTGVLLIGFAILSIASWRGTALFPRALYLDGRYLADLVGLAVVALAYVVAMLTQLNELSTMIMILLTVALLAAVITTFLLMVSIRQRDPDRIRPITPLDAVADALTDFFYSVLSYRNTRRAAEAVSELSKQYGLEVDPHAVVEKLPVGLQQRVEIVKALYRKADILILDEPTAVLTPQEGEELFKIMRELSSQGVSIIFITHKLKEVFKVATNVVVMRGGKVVGTTTPTEATEASLAAMMVGRDVLLRVEKDVAKPTTPILHVENLRAIDERGALALNGVSFEVRAGEVLGVAGVQGNGQSELVEVLTGLRVMEEGAVELLGQELKPRRYPDGSLWHRAVAVVLDVVLVGMLALLFSYFWSYFGEGPNSFEAISTQTLIVFVLFDAFYHLTFWLLPYLTGTADADGAATVDLENAEQVQFGNAAGLSFGQSVMSLEITGKDDQMPSILALVLRYLGYTVSRYLWPIYLLLTAIFAVATSGDRGIVAHWRAVLRNAWYDHLLPGQPLRVAHRSIITSRKIKDLETGHVPEDRLRFGLVKPFTVAENLILNDYYEAPHAQSPSALQLPFVSGVYAALFAGIFAVLGYAWLYLWNTSLWNGLLDNFGVPEGPQFRTLPTDRGFVALERVYLNDPLVVSLVILLGATLLFSAIAYGLTLLIIRYLARPFSFVPPLTIVLAAYVLLLLVDGILLGGLGLRNTLLLPFIQLMTDAINVDSTLSDAENQGILATATITIFLILGLAYDRIGRNTTVIASAEDTAFGKMVMAQNRHGLSLVVKDTLGHSNQLIEAFDIRTPSPLTAGGSLSGGNQQKLVVAREFSREPRLLIASQPTRGIDVGSIEFIHKQIIEQRDRGAAVLLVSAELDEVMSLSDRIAVMYKGEIIKVVDAEVATRETLGLLMAGIDSSAG